MKKTILFAFALVAILFTTALSGQVTRPGGGSTTGGTTSGSGSGAGSQGGSSAGAGSQAGSGTTAPGAMVSYPKVFISTPAATKGGKSSRRLLAGNPFKGKNQGTDLTYDIVDAQGNVIKDDVGAITKGADGDMVIDASKLKSKTGNRLRIKGAGTAVEFYPF